MIGLQIETFKAALGQMLSKSVLHDEVNITLGIPLAG